MRCELPEFTRCCFCIPLRRGLLIWGYFKMVVILLTLVPAGFMFYFVFCFTGTVHVKSLILVVVLIIDFAFNFPFLVAAHTKKFKLFRVYYYYLMVITILTTIVILILMAQSTAEAIMDDESGYAEKILTVGCGLAFVNIISQFYIMLLVKSEINKLQNNYLFEFVNNTAEMEAKANLELENDINDVRIVQPENEIKA